MSANCQIYFSRYSVLLLLLLLAVLGFADRCLERSNDTPSCSLSFLRSCLIRRLCTPICRLETASDRLVSHTVAWKTRSRSRFEYMRVGFTGIVNSGRCCRGCAEVELSKGKYGYLGYFGTISNVWIRE